jgi:tRNA-specific 2-thiouridylase
MPFPAAHSDSAETVIVGMSGGVDSAVAALLLQEAGFSVQGLYMSNWDDDDDAYCTAAEDFQDARAVCETLAIPLHRVSFASEYRERVFARFLSEYAAGRTPNPDVLCNREIKFGVCLDYMHRLGAGRIATGHYARLVQGPGGARLLKARDASKDQSYFLHGVPPRAFANTLFPLGEIGKDEVRRRAHAAGLRVFDKPDSTGICFIGERPFEDFLSRYLKDSRGPSRRRKAAASASIAAWRSTPSGSARGSVSAASRARPMRPGTWPARTRAATRSSSSRITSIRC